MGYPSLISDEELALVKLAVMLPIVLDTLEHDNKKFKATELKVPTVYVANNKQLQQSILNEMKGIKREMINRGIKIFEQGKTKTGYHAKYLCRGYRHEMEWLSDHIKSFVVIKLGMLMGFPIDLIVE